MKRRQGEQTKEKIYYLRGKEGKGKGKKGGKVTQHTVTVAEPSTARSGVWEAKRRQ